MTDKMKVTFTCPKCGPTVLSVEDEGDDSCHATCKSCGLDFGPLGAIKERARTEGQEKLNQMVRDAFKGVKGFKLSK